VNVDTEAAPDGTGKKHFSDRHERVTISGAAGWALAGGILLSATFVIAHVYRLQFLEPTVSLSRFELPSIRLPQETLARAARPGSFPLLRADPPSLSLSEAKAYKLGRGKFLVKGDPVIGVELGGQARAYPLRFLDFHELVNDTVGDVPIAIAWSPLSGTAAVFQRRVGGTRLELEPSGLLSNCVSLLADNASPPSLWSPVHGKAVAGPAAERGETLTRVPFVLMRWSDWSDAHPKTRVLQPAPELVKVYKTVPYRAYLGSDELRFPAAPLAPADAGAALGIKLLNKTPILAVTVQGQRLVYPMPLIAARAGADGLWKTTQNGQPLEFRYWPGNRSDNPPTAVVSGAAEAVLVLPSYWFAWHANYPDDVLAQ
jgi:hypothetical protein